MEQRPYTRSVIARRFVALRKKGLLTQLRLGEIIEICRQTVCEIENARVMPHESTWEAFRNLEATYREADEVQLPTHWV